MNADFEIHDAGDGHFDIRGDMTFHTVAAILQESLELFEDHTMIEVDMADVRKTDSAGLSLLLEWTTWANHTVREIHFRNVPEKLVNIARTSDVEDLLTLGERWVGFIDDRTRGGLEEGPQVSG